MDVLLLKLSLTPLLVLAVSLAQRRWGHLAGGRLAALPLTTGPFLVVLAATAATPAATAAARSVLLAMPAVLVYYAAYRALAHRLRWPACLGAATAAMLPCAALLADCPTPVALVLLALGYLALRRRWPPATTAPVDLPAWELPGRAATATAVVIGLGLVTPLLGPATAGLLAAFPALGCVVLAFTHHRTGADGTTRLIGGLLTGMPWTVLFLLLLTTLLPLLPVWAAVTLACVPVLTPAAATALAHHHASSPPTTHQNR